MNVHGSSLYGPVGYGNYGPGKNGPGKNGPAKTVQVITVLGENGPGNADSCRVICIFMIHNCVRPLHDNNYVLL